VNSHYLLSKIENAQADNLIDKVRITLLSERTRRYNTSVLIAAFNERWRVVAPFMDNQFADLMLQAPRDFTDSRQRLFKNVVSKYIPHLALVPVDKTGKRINSTWCSWRLEYLKGRVPARISTRYAHLKDRLRDNPFAQKIMPGGNREWLVDCDQSIRTGSASYFRELFSDKENINDLFVHSAVQNLFDAHLNKRVNAYHKLCAIATIIEWRRQFGL
jgi:hypothetical protein